MANTKEKGKSKGGSDFKLKSTSCSFVISICINGFLKNILCFFIYYFASKCVSELLQCTNKPASTNNLHKHLQKHSPSFSLRATFFFFFLNTASIWSISCILKGFCGGKSLQKYFLVLYMLEIVFGTS